MADELAKQAAASEFIGPEPVFGISSDTAPNFLSGAAQLTNVINKQQTFSQHALTAKTIEYRCY